MSHLTGSQRIMYWLVIAAACLCPQVRQRIETGGGDPRSERGDP